MGHRQKNKCWIQTRTQIFQTDLFETWMPKQLFAQNCCRKIMPNSNNRYFLEHQAHMATINLSKLPCKYLQQKHWKKERNIFKVNNKDTWATSFTLNLFDTFFLVFLLLIWTSMCAGLLFDLSYELNSSMFQYHLKMEATVKVPMEMEGMKNTQFFSIRSIETSLWGKFMLS